MFEKYICINPDKYQASVSQSKTTGLWFCDKLSVNAGSRRELKNELDAAINDINIITNKYNKEETKKREKNKTDPMKDNKARM